MRKNAAIGIIFNQERAEVLLVKRQDVPVWVLPGGGVESDENSGDAVVREVLEETGLRVKVIRKSAEYIPTNNLTRLTEVFECAPIEGELQKGPETSAISFFPINQLPQNFFFLHEEWLQDTLKNHPGILQKHLKHITYWNLAKYFLKHPTWVIRFLATLVKSKG